MNVISLEYRPRDINVTDLEISMLYRWNTNLEILE